MKINGSDKAVHNFADMTLEQMVFRIVVVACIAKTYGLEALGL